MGSQASLYDTSFKLSHKVVKFIHASWEDVIFKAVSVKGCVLGLTTCHFPHAPTGTLENSELPETSC